MDRLATPRGRSASPADSAMSSFRDAYPCSSSAAGTRPFVTGRRSTPGTGAASSFSGSSIRNVNRTARPPTTACSPSTRCAIRFFTSSLVRLRPARLTGAHHHVPLEAPHDDTRVAAAGRECELHASALAARDRPARGEGVFDRPRNRGDVELKVGARRRAELHAPTVRGEIERAPEADLSLVHDVAGDGLELPALVASAGQPDRPTNARETDVLRAATHVDRSE